MKNICLFFICIASILASPELIAKAKEVEKTFSISELSEVQNSLLKSLEANPNNEDVRYWYARICLRQCNVERFFRREFPKAEGKNITRPTTAKTAEKGVEVLEPLMKKKPNWSDLHRIKGELYSHLIVGFLSGMSKGPQALSYITKSIELDKTNPLGHIANAKMYYYNPPIAGGDVDKAIALCKKAIKLGGGERAYTLLGRCYVKKERPKRAELYLRKAIKLNAKNKEARYFLDKALEKK